jgi:hypothetical protein
MSDRRIHTVIRVSRSTPAQWDLYLDDGYLVTVRYRNGNFYAAKVIGDYKDDDIVLIDKQYGNKDDNEMSTEGMMDILESDLLLRPDLDNFVSRGSTVSEHFEPHSAVEHVEFWCKNCQTQFFVSPDRIESDPDVPNRCKFCDSTHLMMDIKFLEIKEKKDDSDDDPYNVLCR